MNGSKSSYTMKPEEIYTQSVNGIADMLNNIVSGNLKGR
jgi:hypothetical protein